MFDNQIIPDENKNENELDTSSFAVSFTDEELVSKNTIDDDEIKKIIDEEENKEEEKFVAINNYLTLKTKIEQILASRDYEDIIVNFVDQLLLNEQNALNDETIKKIRLQKYIAGLTFGSVNCYGDQRNFLLLMAERLGVRR